MGMAGGFELPARICLPTVQDDADRRDEQTASSKGLPWTEEEHLAFLQGLRVFGKGKWRQISRTFLNRNKTPTQVASHAQKYFARLQGTTKRKSRFTQLEEKATGGFPSKASLQALPPLAQSSQQIATSAGLPGSTYVPLHIEPLSTPAFPEPAQVMACQTLAKLCQPLAVRASSPARTSSAGDSSLSCSSQQNTPAVQGTEHSAFTSPPSLTAA